MSNIANFNTLRAFDRNGVPVSGAQAWFYDSGTDQARPVYADIGATVQHPQPLVADATGIFPAVFVLGADPLRVIMRDADGVMMPGYPLDPAFLTSVSGTSADGIAFAPTDEIPASNVQLAIEMLRDAAIEPVLAFGIGTTGEGPLMANLNATGLGAGIYRVTSATTGTFPTGVAAADGIVLLERHSALRATQTLKMIAGGIYVRRLSTTWGAWEQLLDAGTHSQAVWNAGENAVPKAVSPTVLKSWRDTWAATWGHTQAIWNAGTNTTLRALSPKILADWLKAKIGTPGTAGLSLLAASDANAAQLILGVKNTAIIGEIIPWIGNRGGIPDGFVALDGQMLNRASYPALWSAVSGNVFPSVSEASWVASVGVRGRFSQGNGSSTFRVPDLNGKQSGSREGLFLRGDGRGAIGDVQGDAIRNITGRWRHSASDLGGTTLADGAIRVEAGGDSSHTGNTSTARDTSRYTFDASRQVPTADENRPVSGVVCWIMRARPAA